MKKFLATVLALSLSMFLVGCGSDTPDEEKSSQGSSTQSQSAKTQEVKTYDEDYFLLSNGSNGSIPFKGQALSAVYSPNRSYKTTQGTTCAAGESCVDVSYSFNPSSSSELMDWKAWDIFFTAVYLDSSSNPLFVNTDYTSGSPTSGVMGISLIDYIYSPQIDAFGKPASVEVWMSSCEIATKSGSTKEYGLDWQKVNEMNVLSKKDYSGLYEALQNYGVNCGKVQINTVS